MTVHPLTDDEEGRLRSLHALDVLDSLPEAQFDALTRAAALICQAPISLISLVDETRQWFKSNHGLPGTAQTPRETAFCAHTVAAGRWFEVEDAAADPRFADNPAVVDSPHLRAYAGAPIRLSEGHVVGALCVADRTPRRLTTEQRQAIEQLSLAAAEALEARRLAKSARDSALALQESEARFRTLSEQAPLGVFETDATGNCVYTNPSWQTIYGLTLSESLGTGWSQTLHPSDRAAVIEAWSRAAGSGSDFEMEFRIIRPDQVTRSVRARARAVRTDGGSISGFVGSVEDVTSRRQLEAFLDRTGRAAGVGGWELDLRTQTLTWSEQTRRIHEVGDDFQPTLDSAVAFYAEDARRVISEAVAGGIERGEPWDLELPLTTATGRQIWVRAMGEAEFDGGKAVRLIGAFKDVTQSRSQRIELADEQSLRLQIERQARETEHLLAERSEMLDVLAHEIRQPLNNASAALQSAASALSKIHNDEPAGSRLARAQLVLSQVLSSLDNTLAVASLLARSEAIERDDTDIDFMLEVCIADLPAEARERIRIDRRTTLRHASMDLGLMRLAVRNLLANALRASPAPDVVRVELSDSDEPLALVIDVLDSGPGFPAELLPFIFQRGMRHAGHRDPGGSSAPMRPAGMGLGLYIVRRVMELHGGSVQLARNSPNGATLRLLLVQPSGD